MPPPCIGGRTRYALVPTSPTMGTNRSMTDPRLEDHLTGLELQLVELVERQTRAKAQGRLDDAAALAPEIEQIQAELTATADRLAGGGAQPHATVRVDVPRGPAVTSPRPGTRVGRRPALRAARAKTWASRTAHA